MITKAHKEDIPRLQEIWESAVLATHDFLAKEDFLFYKSNMPMFLGQTNLYKYTDGDNVILAFLASDQNSIDMLFVHNEARSRGIGKALARYAMETLGATMVDVNEQNVQAVGFYNHMGFKEIDRKETDDFDKPYPILCLSL